jgi:hypothetical protein
MINSAKQHITGIAKQRTITTPKQHTIQEFYLLGYNTV